MNIRLSSIIRGGTCKPGPGCRCGYTLIELIAAVGSSAVLMIGLASTILISNAALDQDTTNRQRTTAGDTQTSLLADLRHATAFTERTANAVTIVVPDRTGDGRPDTIRYAWSGTAGDPLTYSVNGSTSQTLVADVHQFGLSYQTETIVAPVIPEEEEGGSGKTVMFVSAGAESGGDSDSDWLAMMFQPDSSSDANFDVNTTGPEDERIALLETWGYTVNKIGASQSDDDFATAFAEADVIYVSPEATAVLAEDKIEGSSLGIVNECTALIDVLGFATDDDQGMFDSIVIDDDSHYITEDFSTGSLTVMTSTEFMTGLKGSLAGGLQTLGSVSNGGNSAPSLVALAAGASKAGGGTAAGRRVLLPWAFPSASIANLNADGQTLMKRAVEWASGEGDDGEPAVAYFGNELVGPDAVSWRRNQVATKFTLDSPGTLKSISVNLGAKDADYRVAIYSDSGGEPGSLLAESATGRSSSSGGWNTLTVPDTALAAGTYWLAVAVDHRDQKIIYHDASGETRTNGQDAASDGFKSSWGASAKTHTWMISIYGTYVPD